MGALFSPYMLDFWEQAGRRQVVLCTWFKASQVWEALDESYNSLSLAYSEETQKLDIQNLLLHEGYPFGKV